MDKNLDIATTVELLPKLVEEQLKVKDFKIEEMLGRCTYLISKNGVPGTIKVFPTFLDIGPDWQLSITKGADTKTKFAEESSEIPKQIELLLDLFESSTTS